MELFGFYREFSAGFGARIEKRESHTQKHTRKGCVYRGLIFKAQGQLCTHDYEIKPGDGSGNVGPYLQELELELEQMKLKLLCFSN